MRKEEHTKIVSGLEAEIKILQNRIGELSKINGQLDFDCKLHKFIADQRIETINKMMSNSINNLKNLSEYEKQFTEFYKQSMERINDDNKKFDELRNYIKKTFPSSIVDLPSFKQNKQMDDEKLSQSVVGENGEIYKSYHIIDAAILIMDNYKNKLKEILGDDDDDDVDFPNKDDENL